MNDSLRAVPYCHRLSADAKLFATFGVVHHAIEFFADERVGKHKQARREIILAEIESVVSWRILLTQISSQLPTLWKRRYIGQYSRESGDACAQPDRGHAA